jgi:prophage maintenance system killer protein
MDQKAIVLYLHMKGMSLDAIHEDLVRVLGENAVAYSTDEVCSQRKVPSQERRTSFTADDRRTRSC